MKLTIKTLDQKTFYVDFDESKTVWDLKSHLCKLPEVGVQPELQQLIYAGRVLDNGSALKTYSIDERKFLVVMAKKAPPATTSEPAPDASDKAQDTAKKSEQSEHTTSAPQKTEEPERQEPEKATPESPPETEVSAPPPPEPTAQHSHLLEAVELAPTTEASDALVQQIMSMGYAEADVRRALLASFNNPDRAIEYLIEGIPEFPEMMGHSSEVPPDSANPLSFLREDPRFNQMRRVIRQRPELLSTVLARIGETNPALLAIIREHQDDFVSMLNENDGELAEGADLGEDVVEVVLTDEERMAVDRLVALGFPREIVLQAYIACEKNEEQTADFLCRHMEE